MGIQLNERLVAQYTRKEKAKKKDTRGNTHRILSEIPDENGL